MKLNKIYYSNLIKSAVIVIAGLVIMMKEVYPAGAVSDNYFILVLVILSAFFGFLGAIAFLMRLDKIRFRRKFVFSFFAVANFFIGCLSIFYSILHQPGLLSVMIYSFGFLVGIIMLADIFFGKRAPKHREREVLIE